MSKVELPNKHQQKLTKQRKKTARYLRVKLQTELLRTHLQGGSKPRNVMIRVWNVTGTNMTPTKQTRIHWNRPMLPILARKPSTLSVIVPIINCKRQERALFFFYLVHLPQTKGEGGESEKLVGFDMAEVTLYFALHLYGFQKGGKTLSKRASQLDLPIPPWPPSSNKAGF